MLLCKRYVVQRCFLVLPSMILLVLVLHLGCGRQSADLVVSGRVEVDDVHVGSRIGGRVWKVNFEEGDEVRSGSAIVQLERAELDALFAQAKAAAAQAQAQLDLLLAGTRSEDLRRAEAVVAAYRAELELRRKGFRDEEVREAEARLASAKSAFEQAKREQERAQGLLQGGSIGQQEFDSKQTALDAAKAALDVADQRVRLVRSGSRPEEIAMAEAQLAQAEADLDRLRNGARPEEIAAARAAVEAAQANVARIATQLEETEIRAPADCWVETLDLQPGDLVQAGQTVAVLNLQEHPWVRCYVPENRLGWVKTGQKVTVTVDTFPGESFPGVVRRVSSEAEFTPRNVQTTEKRVELVFEMKVDVVEKGDRLRAGMYADVRMTGEK